MSARLQAAEFHRRVDEGERPTGSISYVAKMAPTQGSDPQVVSFVFSDNSVDSYNDTIDARGWEWDKTGAGTVALFGHDPSSVDNIVGRAHNIHVQGNRLVGDIHFASAEENPKADVVRRLVLGGFINSVSVGFQPLEWKLANDPSRPGGINFIRQQLLEISVVAIPANSNAITLARNAGIDVDRVAKMFAAPRSTPSDVASRRAKAAAVKAAAANDNGRFKSLGENVIAILKSERDDVSDSRLVRAPSGANVNDPSAGGFLIQDDLAQDLIASVYESAVIAPLCDNRTTDHPTRGTSLPGLADESRADGSRNGSVLTYWEPEAATVSKTFPKFKSVGFQPRKLFGLARCTRELLSDVSMLDAHLRSAFGEELAWQVDRAVLTGTGAGVPLGVLNSAALITVAKAIGQAPATIVAENTQAMFARLPAPSRRRAVWLVNEDVESILSTFPVQIYQPAGMNGSQYATLHGRPVIVIEQASALGTPGDIVLSDLSRYVTVSAPAQFVISLDAAFDTDEAAFRATWMIDGKPLHSAPITPFNGTATRSPFVALQAR
jgi:HK97 family phage major capsid protein